MLVLDKSIFWIPLSNNPLPNISSVGVLKTEVVFVLEFKLEFKLEFEDEGLNVDWFLLLVTEFKPPILLDGVLITLVSLVDELKVGDELGDELGEEVILFNVVLDVELLLKVNVGEFLLLPTLPSGFCFFLLTNKLRPKSTLFVLGPLSVIDNWGLLGLLIFGEVVCCLWEFRVTFKEFEEATLLLLLEKNV